MNLVEHYIEEVHSVKPYVEDWTRKLNKPFVIVELTYNCYGTYGEHKWVYSVDEWNEIREKGFYLG